jgi:hypothetical protein
MQVQTRSNSYNQAPRPSGQERKTVENETTGTSSRVRRDDAITGSQAVLSNSLADALWSIHQSSTVEDQPSYATVEDIYRAYAN